MANYNVITKKENLLNIDTIPYLYERYLYLKGIGLEIFNFYLKGNEKINMYINGNDCIIHIITSNKSVLKIRYYSELKFTIKAKNINDEKILNDIIEYAKNI